MYKKKKLAKKKHRKNQERLKALKVVSFLKAKPKKKIVSAPIEVETMAPVKKPVAKKVDEKAIAKKAPAKKAAAKKAPAKKAAAKKSVAKKPTTKAKANK